MTSPFELPAGEGAGSEEEELPRMTLLAHLEELRRRLIYSLVGILVAFAGCWTYHREIFRFLERPIRLYLPEDTKLAVFGVPDALFLYIKVAALAAVFVVSPFLLYQLWCFVAPGLYRRERRFAGAFVTVGSLFFLAGGAFAYWIAVPFAVEFLLDFGDQFEQVIAVDKYLRFEMTLILGLGVMFELPMLLFALAQMGVVTPRFLLRNFRWAVLIIFVVAAIITPTPDVFNLMVFALPTIVLYLLGVGAALIVQRRKKGRQEQDRQERAPGSGDPRGR